MANIISMEDFRKPVSEEEEEVFDLDDHAIGQLEHVSDLLNHFLEGRKLLDAEFMKIDGIQLENLGELGDVKHLLFCLTDVAVDEEPV